MWQSIIVGLLLCVLVFGQSQVIDRVAVIVGRTVITEQQVLADLHARALATGTTATINPATKREAAERLVNRSLIRRELALILQSKAESDQLLNFLNRRNQEILGTAALKTTLSKAQLTEQEWLEYLTDMFVAERLIDLRFRPAVQLTDDDVEDFYEIEFTPYWTRNFKTPVPKLSEARDQVEKTMLQARVNQALTRWLSQTKLQTRIRFVEGALQ
jgi:hypothetical protein